VRRMPCTPHIALQPAVRTVSERLFRGMLKFKKSGDDYNGEERKIFILAAAESGGTDG